MEDHDAGVNPAAAVADSAEVMSSLASSGALDALRRRALDVLKHNAKLQQQLQTLVENSKAWKNRQPNENKRKLFQSLMREIEGDIKAEGMQSFWEVLSSPEYNVSAQVEASVQEALCARYEERSRAGQAPAGLQEDDT